MGGVPELRARNPLEALGIHLGGKEILLRRPDEVGGFALGIENDLVLRGNALSEQEFPGTIQGEDIAIDGLDFSQGIGKTRPRAAQDGDPLMCFFELLHSTSRETRSGSLAPGFQWTHSVFK